MSPIKPWIWTVIVMGLAFVGCQKDDAGMNTDNSDDAENQIEPVKVDPGVTRELYLKWRSPRFGKSNPEPMNNPVWEWLIKTPVNAYLANTAMKGPSPFEAGPSWCFDRMGQTTNLLADGRTIFIAGEHEDSYDPDFYIYNDVVIKHPDGRIDIFGYPKAIFPPTDFHTATLVGNHIIIIGNLGYPGGVLPGKTQVLTLNTETFQVSAQITSGEGPGWLHKHTASLAEDGKSILVQRGKVDRGSDTTTLVDNVDDWRLWLNDYHWERVTKRNWSCWVVRRKDGEMNHLFDYQQAIWAKEMPGVEKEVEKHFAKFAIPPPPTLEEKLGKKPDFNLFTNRYHPPLTYRELPPDNEEYGIKLIMVDSASVRYAEGMSEVKMTVEGTLPEATIEILKRDFFDKFSSLENVPCEIIKL